MGIGWNDVLERNEKPMLKVERSVRQLGKGI